MLLDELRRAGAEEWVERILDAERGAFTSSEAYALIVDSLLAFRYSDAKEYPWLEKQVDELIVSLEQINNVRFNRHRYIHDEETI